MNPRIKLSLFTCLLVLLVASSCSKNEIASISSITLNTSAENFTLAQTDSLIATIAVTGDINKFPVTWSTSNANIVSVVKGKIEGVSVGKATITAKAGGLTATCDVNVSNEIYPVVTVGHLIYRGDKFKSGISNYFEVYLFGKTDSLVLSFNLPLAIKDTLPVRTYTVLPELKNKSDLQPYTSNPTFTTDGITAWGTYFIGKTINPVESGSIVITTINKNYAIEYNLIDFYGNIIYGTFQGNLTYHDMSASSSVAPLKGMSIVKHARLLNKIRVLSTK